MPYRVKEVADLVSVSVRTLHHYDHIGLLKPDCITEAGYRLYSDNNLERLQQILFFKEMGFRLEEIQMILDQPDFERKKALYMHKELLIKKMKKLEDMIHTVNQTIRSMEGEINMRSEELFEGFDMKEIEEAKAKYTEEARQKYGKKIVDETLNKTNRYTKEDWATITKKQGAIYQKIADGMERGPDDPQVLTAIGEWRQLITDSFYNCTLDIFRGLGDLYVADERFSSNIDKHQPGLAAFMREAMHVYCDRHEGK
jgi:MerR family transcriptional regulator, multidrug-efflux activator